MAARRFTKSAIDWVAFAERVPENQKHLFQSFKARSDSYLRRVLSYPENPPSIDWAYYRRYIAKPGLVDEYEKKYTDLKIPYPSENATPQINDQEKKAEKECVEFVKSSNERIAAYKEELTWWNNLLPFDQMTLEDYKDAFPEVALDPINRPTFWPHAHDEEDGEIFQALKKGKAAH